MESTEDPEIAAVLNKRKELEAQLFEVNESLTLLQTNPSNKHPEPVAATSLCTLPPSPHPPSIPSPSIPSNPVELTQLPQIQRNTPKTSPHSFERPPRLRQSASTNLPGRPKLHTNLLHNKASQRKLKEFIRNQRQHQAAYKKEHWERQVKAERMRAYSRQLKATPQRTRLNTSNNRGVTPYAEIRRQRVIKSMEQVKLFNPQWNTISSAKNLQTIPEAVHQYAREIERIARKREVLATSVPPLSGKALLVETNATELLLGSIQTKMKLIQQALL